MSQPILTRALTLTCAALLAVSLAFSDPAVVAQEADAKAKTPAAQKTKKFRGRLPAHYGGVVKKDQRQAIYKVQEEYAGKISELKAQLRAITKERDEKITALLTPEQLAKVNELKATAKSKRQAKAGKTLPLETTVTTPAPAGGK